MLAFRAWFSEKIRLRRAHTTCKFSGPKKRAADLIVSFEMKRKLNQIALALIIVISCSSNNNQILILSYDEFGPQSMAWETIGMQWWQWDNHGDSDPNTKYDIKIAIYRNIPLQDVKKRFPVIKESQKDYRYLEYNAALRFLDTKIHELQEINEQWARDIVNRFSRVRGKIVKELK